MQDLNSLHRKAPRAWHLSIQTLVCTACAWSQKTVLHNSKQSLSLRCCHSDGWTLTGHLRARISTSDSKSPVPQTIRHWTEAGAEKESLGPWRGPGSDQQSPSQGTGLAPLVPNHP